MANVDIVIKLSLHNLPDLKKLESLCTSQNQNILHVKVKDIVPLGCRVPSVICFSVTEFIPFDPANKMLMGHFLDMGDKAENKLSTVLSPYILETVSLLQLLCVQLLRKLYS